MNAPTSNLILVLGLLLAASPAHAQQRDASVAPGCTGSSASLCRQTLHDKFLLYAVGTFGPRALCVPLFPASSRMAFPPDRYPRDWRQGLPALGRNYADRFAAQTSFQTARFATSAILHEDLLYHRSASKSPLVRAGHAVVYSFVRNGGHPWIDRSALHMHNSILNTPLAGLSGRSLLSSLSALTAAGLIDAPFVAGALGSARSLGRLAVQAPSAEGTWSAVKVEGAIPEELNGELYRVAPGQKTNHGIELRHFFDGDAFLVKYRLREGKATVSARFVATPERDDETATGRMLYSEFGTLAPAPAKGRKNQPSINVIIKQRVGTAGRVADTGRVVVECGQTAGCIVAPGGVRKCCAPQPMAVLPEPVALTRSAPSPTAVLSVPVVLGGSAPNPALKLPDPSFGVQISVPAPLNRIFPLKVKLPSTRALPLTSSFVAGVVVPIPTFPLD